MGWGACRHQSTVPPKLRLKWLSHWCIERTGGPDHRDAACARSRCSCPEGESFTLHLGPAFDLAGLVNLLHDGVPIGIVRQSSRRAQDAFAPLSCWRVPRVPRGQTEFQVNLKLGLTPCLPHASRSDPMP